MAWDSRSTRRRQNSSVSNSSRSLPLHVRQPSKGPVQAKSAHVSDPFLQSFLDPAFDAADYLNTILPPLQGSSTSSSSLAVSRSQAKPVQQQQPVPLAELSAEAQTLLTQLNAHTTRLTNTLTQLTDDILRSGSRLAYEVELLRGEALGLEETLTDGLREDVEKFVPGGLGGSGAKPAAGAASTDGSGQEARQRRASLVSAPSEEKAESAEPSAAAAAAEAAAPNEPPYITHLRTLTLVRSRLESVIKTFGDAMEFVLPPSEVSVSSSFLSVSAPDPGAEADSTEEKGQQVLQRLRDEVADLLAGGGGGGEKDGEGAPAADPVKGIEDAARRIEELKELARVWKGTAEEKGRARFIESLAKMVEDRHRELLREMEQDRRRGGEDPGSGSRRDGGGGPAAEGGAGESKGYAGGYGFISQLQKIRNGL
ncbi:Laminin subunit beta-4 [Pleurostoma richardsiae]|uniref:Laminin subunit beta-4 n=1 Tax=Pleurostoma richardsiae TaxID=41990 RepID=A0AA38VDS3_9PEZI|nr:Laminin subunit beta-4 [Pleurostoma richardsiae]